jgi:Tfp pilus assembly major pilin PilA
MGRGSAGFTAIELVLAIFVLLALATITVYAYQTYSVRDQVGDALRAIAPVQRQIEHRYQQDRMLPIDRVAAGLSADPADTVIEEVASIEVVRGRIVLVFGREALERIVMDRLSLTPFAMENGSLVWRCGDGPVPDGARPLAEPQKDSEAVDLATIPDRYLPVQCRSPD